MRKSILFTTCLPRSNSIPTAHFTTKLGRQGCRRKTKTRSPNDHLDYNDIDYNNITGDPLHNFQKMSLCILLAKGVLPLVPIQHYTPRHRAHGYFRRGCKPGFGGSHVGAFRIRRSPPSQLRITGYPHAYDMQIIKLCCCQQLQVDWQNIILCDLDRNIIKLPALGKISLWSTNDLESIEANIPYQIRVYGRVLDLVIPLEIKDNGHITDHRLY